MNPNPSRRVHAPRFLRALPLAAAAALLLAPLFGHSQSALPDVVKPPAAINLGSTSFYDGFGRTKPGVTLLQYFRWSHNTQIDTVTGQENPNFLTPRIDAFPSLTQAIVISRWHPFGGSAGFSVLAPLVEENASFAAASPKRLSANGFGLGDIVGGPIFQSKYFVRDPSGPGQNSYFAYRLQLLVQAPTGKFDPAKSINPGSGYWAVAPYLAASWLPVSRLEMSTRFHYQYNLATGNIANPPHVPNLVYKSGQAGQLLYDNFTASWKLTPRFYLGANAYGLYQLSPDKTNGVSAGKARETQFYLGPGGGYNFSARDTLNVNLYLKMEAHNSAAGPSLQLLYIHRF